MKAINPTDLKCHFPLYLLSSLQRSPNKADWKLRMLIFVKKLKYIVKKAGITYFLLWTFVACSPTEEELFENGITQLKNQNFTEAVEYFNRLLDDNPDNTSAHNAKGVALFEMKKWDQAIASFNASIELDSTSYKPFFNRGNVYLEKKEFTKAIIDYNLANGLAPQQVDIYYNRGLALLGLESYEDAIFDFDKALQIDPNQPNVYFNKGKAQLGNNDPMAAMESLTNTINLDQRNAAAYYLLGITGLSALGEKKEGCANLRMALSLGYNGANDWIDKFCEING